MKVGVVILNYNDEVRTNNTFLKMVSYNIFDKLIIIDNNSNKKSVNAIKKIKHPKLKIFLNKKNIGYGAGNNVGIRYLNENKFDYVFLINNDILISKKSICDCIKFLNDHKKCVAVTPLMIEHNKIKRNFYDIPTLANTLNFISSTFGKRSKSMKLYDGYLTSDFVRESATLYRIKALKEINYFDENIFMFEEGSSTGFKFKKLGYFEAVLTSSEPYIHNHKGPLINRKLFAINKKSRIYFFKNYLKYNSFKIFIFKLYWLNIFIK